MIYDLKENNLYVVDFIDTNGNSRYQEFYIPKFFKVDDVGVALALKTIIDGEVAMISELYGHTYNELKAMLEVSTPNQALKYFRPIYLDQNIFKKSMAN